MNRARYSRKVFVVLLCCLCVIVAVGCEKKQSVQKVGHEPLTILTANIKYDGFVKLLKEKYPEVNLEFISYTGPNPTGYSQYLLTNDAIPDIYTTSVFSTLDKQAENLLDLSVYEFLNNYKTVDINQVTLDGAVYLVPASLGIVGLYYNETMFKEYGWEVPKTIDELLALGRTIKEAGIDPIAAQFELPGNGFFDLFTIAKTGFLSTTEGLQWERDFQAGKATAEEGLSDAVVLLQKFIDSGLLDTADTERGFDESDEHFRNRGAAMYLNAGTIASFSQNQDGTGDQYGIMPFPGITPDDTVLITIPLRYFGLSRHLAEPGNEQKLADALKVMEVLATEEGQGSLGETNMNYVASLRNSVIPEDSSFHEVEEVIRSGHTSTLAYAGYEPIIIGVGEKVRDWVAGRCTGADVLALMDDLQTEYLNGAMPPVAVASRDFSLEETALLEAEAFRSATGADIGMVSLGGYHDGVENYSGVCGKIFQGDISQEVVNAIVSNKFVDPLCILTLSGEEIRNLLEVGFVVNPDVDGFPYVPAGISVSKNADGMIQSITWPDGSAFDESGTYTIAIDEGAFTEEIGQRGNVKETSYIVVDVVGTYLRAHSPLV